MRPYVIEYYKTLFKRALNGKEMTIDELQEKTGLPRGTLVRWVDILTAGGFLKERWEGNKKFISLNK